jgi:6-phosphogluconolactonase
MRGGSRGAGYDLFVSTTAGLYRVRLSAEGAVHGIVRAAGLHSPSFLQMDSEAGALYAVCEYGGGASIAMFGISDRGCEKIRENTFNGDGACHLFYSKRLRAVFASCYGSGDFFRFDSESLRCEARYRAEPFFPGADFHAHCAVVDRTGRYLICADLGQDLLSVFSLKGGWEKPVFQAACPKGTGPRQMVFHPFADFLYCVEETGNSVSVYSFISSSGELRMLQRIAACGETDRGNYPSGITTTPDGKFLYVSNRGADTVAVFRLLPAGLMKIQGEFPSCGSFPRHILLTRDMSYLIVSNQRSAAAVCPVDAATGGVEKAVDFIRVFQPNCAVEYRPKNMKFTE